MRSLFVLLLCLLPGFLWAENVALVIGNAAYQNVAPLPTPRHDALAISQALRQQGLQVTLSLDQTRAQMLAALRSFRSRADAAELALIYYAGHGIEIGGRNYVIPIDARLADTRDARFELIELADILAQVSGAQRMRMVVLDANRNNPFADRMTQTRGDNLGRGLTIIRNAKANTLIVYAAAAGEIIPDNSTKHQSPFTDAFLAALDRPPKDVRLLLGDLQDNLRRTAPGSTPYLYSTLSEDRYILNPNHAGLASSQTHASRSAAPIDEHTLILDFATAELANAPQIWGDFLDKYTPLSQHPLYLLARRRHALALSLARPAPAIPETKPRQAAARPLPPPTAAPELSKPDALRQIQTLLKARNCYTGRIDGIYGRQTGAGLRQLSAKSGADLTMTRNSAPQQLAAVITQLEQLSDYRCPVIAAAPVRPKPQSRRPKPARTVPQAPAATAPARSETGTGTVYSNPPNTCPVLGSAPGCRDGSPIRN